MGLFEWAYLRKDQRGIKVHTLFAVVTQMPTYIHITEARLHNVKTLDEMSYETILPLLKDIYLNQ